MVVCAWYNSLIWNFQNSNVLTLGGHKQTQVKVSTPKDDNIHEQTWKIFHLTCNLRIIFTQGSLILTNESISQ